MWISVGTLKIFDLLGPTKRIWVDVEDYWRSKKKFTEGWMVDLKFITPNENFPQL